MARIRTIKPSFFTSLSIAELSVEARLTFIGLWTHCDDEGRCVAEPRLIKAALWPLDDRTVEAVADDLRQLASSGRAPGALPERSLIVHYEVAGRRYIQVSGWAEHQKISKPTPSALPPAQEGKEVPVTCVNTGSRSAPGALPERSLQERKGREQGRERIRPTAGATAPRAETTVEVASETTQALVAEWVDHCRERPPGRVIGHLSKEIKAMLDEGVAYSSVRHGLAVWATKGLSPSSLASVVNETMNGSAANGVVGSGKQRANQQILERAWLNAKAAEAGMGQVHGTD